MEPLFKGKKSHRQIKSFDQRMKLSFLKRNMDIPEAIIESLDKQIAHLKPEDQDCLSKFKSYYEKKMNQQNSGSQKAEYNDTEGFAIEEDDTSRGLGEITRELKKLYDESKSDRERVKSIHQMVCLNHRWSHSFNFETYICE